MTRQETLVSIPFLEFVERKGGGLFEVRYR